LDWTVGLTRGCTLRSALTKDHTPVPRKDCFLPMAYSALSQAVLIVQKIGMAMEEMRGWMRRDARTPVHTS